jgi:amidase
MATEPWTEIAAKYREKVAAQLPPEWRLPEDLLKTISADNPIDVTSVPSTCGILTPKELEITEQYDAVALVEKMVAKELTSEEVTLAFCKRAAIAKQVVCSFRHYIALSLSMVLISKIDELLDGNVLR